MGIWWRCPIVSRLLSFFILAEFHNLSRLIAVDSDHLRAEWWDWILISGREQQFPSWPIRVWRVLSEVGNVTQVSLILSLTHCRPHQEALLCLGPVEIYRLPSFFLVYWPLKVTTRLHDLHPGRSYLCCLPFKSFAPAWFFPTRQMLMLTFGITNWMIKC